MAWLSPTSSLSTCSWSRSERFSAVSDCLQPQLVDGVAELLGDGDGELQVLGVQRLVRVGAVEVDQAEHALADACTGAQIRLVAPSLGQALAVAQVAVAGHVLRQDRLAAGQHLVADVLRHAAVGTDARVAVTVGRHFQLGPAQ